MKLRSIIAGLVGLSLGTWLIACQAEAYRWTDSEGVVNFSQFPPPGQNATPVADTPIDTLSGGATPAPAPQSPIAPTTAGKPLETPPAPAQADQKTCDTARANLAALQSGQRLKVQMPDGSVHWMAETERATRLKETKDFLSQRCK